MSGPSGVEVAVVGSDDVDAATRAELAELWRLAFGARFDEHDAEHAFGGVHVLARVDGRLVGHASAVPRSLRFGDGDWRTVGYVEAVATEPARQGEGIGTLVMRRLQAEIGARWGLAMLSTGRATGFYAGLGWQRWLGMSFTQKGSRAVPDGEHGGLMVFGTSQVPDRTLTVTCQDRPGDAW